MRSLTDTQLSYVLLFFTSPKFVGYQINFYKLRYLLFRLIYEFGGKCGTECLNTRFPLPAAYPAYPAACGIQREADLILIFYKVKMNPAYYL